jgi:hypothetical protein
MFGFRLEDDDEASRFYETIMIRTKERRASSIRVFLKCQPTQIEIGNIALIKPNPLSRSWSKSVQRRRSTLPVGSLAFSAMKITNPEPGSFKHRAHLGLDEKGHILAEGEVDKEWSVLFNGIHGKTNLKVRDP